MADKRLKIDITAKDKTKAAFAAVGSGLRKLTSAAKVVGLAVIGASAAIAVLGKRMADTIDETAKLSRQLGLSLQAIETFRLASDLGGTSLESFAKASKKLSAGALDFLEKGTGTAAEAFEQLGISTADLRPIMNDSVAMMGLIADKFNEMPQGALKTAAAYKLFGAKGTDLINVLEGGSQKLIELGEEVKRFGHVLTVEQAGNVEKANDEFSRLQSLFSGIAKQLTAEVFPVVAQFATIFRDKVIRTIEDSYGSVEDFAKIISLRFFQTLKIGIKFSQAFVKIFAFIGTQAAHTIEGLVFAFDELKKFISDFNKFFSFLTGFEGGDPTSTSKKFSEFEALGDIGPILDDITDGFKELGNMIDDINNDPLDESLKKAKMLKEELTLTGDAGEKAFQKINEATKEFNESVDSSNKEVGGVKDTVDRLISAADQVGDIIAGGFEKAAFSAKSFSDILKEVALDLAKLVFRKTITEPLAEGISGLFSGFLGGFFKGGGSTTQATTPGAQFGGLALSNRATLVGESGPEIIVPTSTGRVIPNGDAFGGGGGVTVNQYFTINAGVPQEARRVLMGLMPFIKSEVAGAMISARNRGGAMATAMGAKG